MDYFFGKLFRAIWKIVKVLAAVLMVVAGVLLISMGHPHAGIALIVTGAGVFASVIGNKTFQTITKWLSIAVSANQIRNRPVTATAPTFFRQAERRNTQSWLVKIIPGAGAIQSFFSRQDDQANADATVSRIHKRAVELLETNTKCSKVISGVYDALETLNGVQKVAGYNVGGGGNIAFCLG
jgi:hypothetical protein